jgi:hypothetical protein
MLVMRSGVMGHVAVSAVSPATAVELTGIRMPSEEMGVVRSLDANGGLHVGSGSISSSCGHQPIWLRCSTGCKSIRETWLTETFRAAICCLRVAWCHEGEKAVVQSPS